MNLIKRYYRIRDGRNFVPKGLVCAEVIGNQINFGFSLCDDLDTFTYKMANQVANERIKSGCIIANLSEPSTIISALQQIPHSMSLQALGIASDIYYRRKRATLDK